MPKRDLVSAPLILMQNGHLKIDDALPLKDVLVKELLNFRVKIDIATAHDSYEAWREGGPRRPCALRRNGVLGGREVLAEAKIGDGVQLLGTIRRAGKR